MQDGYVDEAQERAEQEQEDRQNISIAKWILLIAFFGLFWSWVLA